MADEARDRQPRVLVVSLEWHGSSRPSAPRALAFGECVADAVGGARVAVGEDGRGAVVLEQADEDEPGAVPLAHAPHCPARSVLRLERPRGCVVRPAAAVLLRDPARRVLLTRRAASLRSFPRCWVWPGGRVDPGESLASAAARETEEETGLRLDPATLRPLCAWESLYPTRREHGFPRAHYLVLFYEAALASGRAEPSPDEVDEMVWVEAGLVAALAGGHAAGPLLARGTLPGHGGGAVDAAALAGVYPNVAGQGVGRGHAFAASVYSSPSAAASRASSP